MKEICARDYKSKQIIVSRHDAYEYVKSLGVEEKMLNYLFMTHDSITMYELDDDYNYFFYIMPPSTGCLKRFDLTYVDADGSKKRPIMLHRVIFGSIERFMGVLIEHYAGAFPLWLSPVQVNVIPVNNEDHLEYSKQLMEEIRNNDIRVKLDDREEKLSYKMRESQTKKVPLTLIIGDNERDNNLVSYRLHGSKETITCSKEEFISKVKESIKNKDYNI
jgi:threonyl-tRNA synthetase